MHPSFYMIEKELIEHKMIIRVPLFILACIILLYGSFLLSDMQGNFHYQTTFTGSVNGIDQHSGIGLRLFIVSGAGLISILLASLYLPKTLRKERLEGSAMFWRSMPVSHLMTLTVKLVCALLVIPLICSILVLTADLLLWIITLTSDNQFAYFFGSLSLLDVLQNWSAFLLQMTIVGLALLPLACITLMVSQLVTSPILVMVIAIYTLKLLPIYLFGFYGVSDFLSAIGAIPTLALTAIPLSENPLLGFIEAGTGNLVIYYLIGVGAFATSLALSKTNESSLRGLFSKHG